MALLLTNGTASIYRKNGSTEGLTQLVSAVSANAQQAKDGAMLDVPGSGVGSDQPSYKALTNIYLGGAEQIGSYSAQPGDLVVFTGSSSPSNWTGTYRVIAETPPAEGFGLDYVKLVCLKESQSTTVNGTVIYVYDTFSAPNGTITGRTPDTITTSGKTWQPWTDYGGGYGGAITVQSGQAVCTNNGAAGAYIDAGTSNGTVWLTFVTGQGYLQARMVVDVSGGSSDFSGAMIRAYGGTANLCYYDYITGTYLDNVVIPGTASAGDTYGLSVNGNTAIAYKNGVQVATTTFTSADAQRVSNLWGFEAIATNDAFDSFKVTS